jgi:nucleoside-diphosphate-sugar epimerase
LKILITGVCGFVGNNLYLKLKKKNELIGIGRKNRNYKNKYKNIIEKEITHKNLVNLNFKPNVIIHCAGSGSVTKSIQNPKIDYEKNVNTTKELIKFISELTKKPKVIMFSTAAVYGNSCEKNKKQLKPISPYGRNKLKSENILLKKSKKFRFELMILRFYSIYGVGLKKQLIWDVCEKINNKINVFYGSGNEMRSWINIKDVNRLIQFLIKKGSISNQTLDISGNDVVKNKFLVKKLFKLLNINKLPYFNKKNKKGDPIDQIFNNSILKNLGWKPKINLSNGLKEYAQWYKKNLKKQK